MNNPLKTNVFRLANFSFRLCVKKSSSSFSSLSNFWKNLFITVAFVLSHNSYAFTYHSLILKTDGSLHTFGYNNFGELGDGTYTSRLSLVTVLGVGNATAMGDAIGGVHSCAVTAAGTVSCWGSNRNGELGDGTTLQQSSPVPVLALAP